MGGRARKNIVTKGTDGNPLSQRQVKRKCEPNSPQRVRRAGTRALTRITAGGGAGAHVQPTPLESAAWGARRAGIATESPRASRLLTRLTALQAKGPTEKPSHTHSPAKHADIHLRISRPKQQAHLPTKPGRRTERQDETCPQGTRQLPEPDSAMTWRLQVSVREIGTTMTRVVKVLTEKAHTPHADSGGYFQRTAGNPN